MNKQIGYATGYATGAFLLLAACAASALETDAVRSLADFDVRHASDLRLAADVDTVDTEEGTAADPAGDGKVETPEDGAPLRQQLNDALDEIKDDGTVDDLKKKYFPAAERPDG